MAKVKEATGVRYVGDGAFVQGVPVRDLTAQEWDDLPEELQAMALAAGIFEPAVGKPVVIGPAISESEQEREQ